MIPMSHNSRLLSAVISEAACSMIVLVVPIRCLCFVSAPRLAEARFLSVSRCRCLADSPIERSLLQRDIEAELAGVRQLRLRGPLPPEEHAREEKLLKDLDAVKRYIGKEIWHIEEEER